MLIKIKATSAGRRHQLVIDRSDLHKGKPEKSLLASGHKKRQGRGFKGHITVRHRGGGVKKKMRIIDWKRVRRDIPGTVQHIEYDPMRSSHLALVYYPDGGKAYIIAPDELKEGDIINAGEKAEIRPGNALPLENIPVGIPIHNLELTPGKGAQMARGAGVAALIQSKDGDYVTVQLPSKELRLLKKECFATIGQVGNQFWKNRKIGKAGRKRLLGIRPTVRGTAQHPDSHPHGGGEGRSGIGLKYPKTPWGKHALGTKTRNKRKHSNRYIVRDRRSK
ncbi:MAG: 50S ribosomal protein L2 [Candidatus Pacebacteria bacterium CG10_big_fil_rev_8_21_14_0_10_42_12]|nr:50S ribosomal protein L2 [Candidatus Paceibacterota bacterium]PIR62823.1 MAG: 50S ribosomal protein L2 [Candidatus Pacebacteria bacterium CG10_big_fil_rev_8_21_14_0_10_42_12]